MDYKIIDASWITETINENDKELSKVVLSAKSIHKVNKVLLDTPKNNIVVVDQKKENEISNILKLGLSARNVTSELEGNFSIK